MRIERLSFSIVVMWMSWSCASADSGALAEEGGSGRGSTPCSAGQQRACPCAGGGFGTQSCDAKGSGFGVCNACPPATTLGVAGMPGPLTSAGNGARAGAGAGAGAAGGSAGRAGGGAGQGGSGGAGAAGARVAGAGGVSSDGKPDPLSAERGATCGVGLPKQCNPDTEKCCKRSLATDSCIPKAQACACDEDNCSVISVACDGPEDCASGQVCCAAGSSRTLTEFSCASSCSSASRQACHAKTDCSSSLTCAISQQLPSISVCTDPRTLEQ